MYVTDSSFYKNTLVEQGLYHGSIKCDTKFGSYAGRDWWRTSSYILHWPCVDASEKEYQVIDANAAYLVECKLSDNHMVGITLTASNGMGMLNVNKQKQVICDKLVKKQINIIDWGIFLTITYPLLLYQSLYHTFGSNYDKCIISVSIVCNRQPWVG